MSPAGGAGGTAGSSGVSAGAPSIGGSEGVAGAGGSGSGTCSTNCEPGADCSAPEACASGVCASGVCAAASCGDGVRNGAETALDCGGGCPGCARGAACLADGDCASAHCADSVCVLGPTAGFDVEELLTGESLVVTLTPRVRAGDAEIVLEEYSFGDGGAFELATSHTYRASGTFTITQRLTDENGLVATSSRRLVVALSGFTPVLLSESDRSVPEVLLSADGLGMEVVDDGAFVGVRSNRPVLPGSGMFYFEGERVTDELSDMYFGVAPAGLPLAAAPGSDDRSVGVDISGEVRFGGALVSEFPAEDNDHYGIVLDYRGATPIVHVLLSDRRDRVDASVPMPAVTEPLFIFVGGRRREVGEQARINPGNDTANFPFHYDAAALMNAAGLDGGALVPGWSQTHAEPPSAAPVLSVSAPVTIELGSEVELRASASDAEDGELGDAIHWEDLATARAMRDTHDGPSWRFTPRAIGIHPIEVSVTDRSGRTSTTRLDVTVTGTMPQFNPVKLVPDELTGRGIELSPNGLGAKWTSFGKYGIRANQGMIGEFRYFEMHRLTPPTNQGGGLVILEGNLDPYNPRDVPPSCSVNHSASVWRNLISEADYDTEVTEYYGFAVDYRGRHPVVYVITQNASPARDTVAHVMTLDDVTVPIYPMLYGNPTDSGTDYDAEINFGASPFRYDPVGVLSAAGYDPSGLVLGWGGETGS